MRRELDKRIVESFAILGVALIVLGVSLTEPTFVDKINQDWRTWAVYTKAGQIGYSENLSGRNRDTVVFFNFLGRKINLSFSK